MACRIPLAPPPPQCGVPEVQQATCTWTCGSEIDISPCWQAAGLLGSHEFAAGPVDLFGIDDINGDTLGHILRRMETLAISDKGARSSLEGDALLRAVLQRTVVVAQVAD